MTAAEALQFNATQVHPMNGPAFRTAKTVTAATTLTASDARRIRYDAAGGAFTLTLYPNPSDGDLIMLQEVGNSANVVTVDGNGKTINGTLTLNTAYRMRGLLFDFTANAWFVFWSNGI